MTESYHTREDLVLEEAGKKNVDHFWEGWLRLESKFQYAKLDALLPRTQSGLRWVGGTWQPWLELGGMKLRRLVWNIVTQTLNFHHWKDVVPFFTKAERWTGPTEQSTLARIIDISNYGTSGRYSIMPNPFNYKVIDSWIFRVDKIRQSRSIRNKISH